MTETQINKIADIMLLSMRLSDRRIWLCSEQNSPSCPACKTTQVQLVDWIIPPPARWKCRECGTKFSFEPNAPHQPRVIRASDGCQG